MIYLTVEELLLVAERALGGQEVKVRDLGLLNASVVRPQTNVFGQEAYPTLPEKAAALVQSIAMNHALVDGNKRLALAAVIAFCGMNGQRLSMTNDEAYDFIIRVIVEHLDVPEIAELLRAGGIS